MSDTTLGRHEHLTFKGNLRNTRYGWLRLTPAYSVHQVDELLGPDTDGKVLDPFCGTGTTSLVCAERGIACDTTDINPFLIWFATAKTRSYTAAEIKAFNKLSSDVTAAIDSTNGDPRWLPPIHQVEKWWDKPTLDALGHAMARINAVDTSEHVRDLLKIAFCRTMMAHAHVSFGHQSMSFKRQPAPTNFLPGFNNTIITTWEQAVRVIATAAEKLVVNAPNVILLDARNLSPGLKANQYSCVITSPPYPNRMSYIRELRPYMYWLGFLADGRSAGELDWQAIGGTWGVATSNLTKWSPDPAETVPYKEFSNITARISERSDVLARYVEKYFIDMMSHCRGLFKVMKKGGTVHYIVGNSKFYDVMLPVEEIYAAMFESVGFGDATIKVSRKRSSKKELFEFIVSATKPRGRSRTPK